MIIAGKLGFSFGVRAVRRFHLNIYSNMYASVTMSLVYQKINVATLEKVLFAKKECINEK